MQAYIQNDIVVGIYTTDAVKPEGCTVIELAGRKDIPQLFWQYDTKGDLFSPPPATEVQLSELKTAALTIVNSETSAVRRSYIGDMESQLAIYTAKFQDAKAFKAKVFGDNVDNYLWVAAEVSATDVTALEAADTFISNYSQMVAAFGKAEEIRIYARREIEKAVIVETIREIKSLAVNELKKLTKAK